MSGLQCLRATIMIFALIWSAGLQAAPRCGDIFRDYSLGGAAVELEMDATNKVLQILTTHNGLVGGLFDRKFTDASIPNSYLFWAKENYPEMDPRLLEWDLLPDNIKRNLIIVVSSGKERTFYEDRSVPGIKVKEVIQLKFPIDTVFLGQTYRPGVHNVDVSNVFKQVEFRSRRSVEKFSGVELHLRSQEISAGDLVKDAWNFQMGIGEKRGHLHEHIVAAKPTGPRQREKAIEIAEYYRRANMLAELIKAFDHGVIMSNKSLTESFFDSAKPNFFSGVFKYFMGDIRDFDGNRFKMAYVSFRTGKTYDQSDMFGFEYRAIGAKRNVQLMRKISDRIQYSLRNESYGFEYSDMREWFESKKLNIEDNLQVQQGLEMAWYHQSYTQLYKRMPENLKAALGKPGWALLKTYHLKISDYGNHALKMLLYDWAADPIYFGDEAGQARVRKIQEFTLSQLFKKSEVHPRDIVTVFVKTSGVFEQVGRTFDLTPQDLQKVTEP